MNEQSFLTEVKSIDVVQIRLVPEKRLYFDTPIRSAVDVYNAIANKMKDFDREMVVMLNNNARGQVMSLTVGSIGGLCESIVSPRELFKVAILSNSASVIRVHNHVSGHSVITPSDEDINATKRMIFCGQLLDIPVMDHIIVSALRSYRYEKMIIYRQAVYLSADFLFSWKRVFSGSKIEI